MILSLAKPDHSSCLVLGCLVAQFCQVLTSYFSNTMNLCCNAWQNLVNNKVYCFHWMLVCCKCVFCNLIGLHNFCSGYGYIRCHKKYIYIKIIGKDYMVPPLTSPIKLATPDRTHLNKASDNDWLAVPGHRLKGVLYQKYVPSFLFTCQGLTVLLKNLNVSFTQTLALSSTMPNKVWNHKI